MSVTLRRIAAIGAPVLLASVLTGCGAGGPPTDAEPEAFCDAQNSFVEEFAGSAASGEPPEPSALYDALQGQVTDLEEVGTPEDIDEDGREGFEIYLDAVGGVDEDEFVEAVESENPEDAGLGDVSEEDQDLVEGYNDYATETCGNPLEELTP